MPEERPSELLGSLPRTRPHRRSTKRPVKPDAGQPMAGSSPVRTASKPAKPRPTPATAAKPKAQKAKPAPRRPARSNARGDTLRQPPQPRGMPSSPRSPVPPAPQRPEVIGTAIQAVAELTEIGLSVTARALRRTLSRLPRP